MPLRCLLFSTNKEIVDPISQVLTELGIDGEYCESAVDAVEKVTTHLFQIIITDWDDQPEASFLLKTARDQKAAQRPLTLAIVSEAARPQALQAGANSVLLKPIRPEQARDTLSTACQLLRAKQQPATPPSPASSETFKASPVAEPASGASAAAPARAMSPASLPLSVTQAPETSFRAGEFLQSATVAPGAQFDTENETKVQKSIEQSAVAEMDALTDLEPMASAVQAAPEAPAEPVEVKARLTGWADLQARLTKNAPQPPPDPPQNEFLSYGETPSAPASSQATPAVDTFADQAVSRASEQPVSQAPEISIASQPDEAEQPQPTRRSRAILWAPAFAACVALLAVPATRQRIIVVTHSAVRATRAWLNPAPPTLPQAVAQHENFGAAGDEYKLPTPTNIPDATTDPSQIQVIPVVDPTAKANKSTDSSKTQSSSVDSNAADSSQAGPAQTQPGTENQPAVSPAPVENKGSDATQPPTAAAPSTTSSAPASPPTGEARKPTPAVAMRMPASTTQASTPADVSSSSNNGIPSSLKSHLAPSTPDASGTTPPEEAMASIEPVKLQESDVRALLLQAVDPQYPANAGALRGSVTVQVLIGRDGSVQDAKFLQGSLVFARVALDAVKQWRFKPYSMNGRPVSVQSVITLSFTPSA